MDNKAITIKWGQHEIPVVMVRGAGNCFVGLSHDGKRVCSRIYIGETECLPISLMYFEPKPVNESWQATMTCFGQEHNAWGESAQDCIDGLRIMLEDAAKEINELLEPEVL